MKRALVLGAGGFIGHHLVRRLAAEGVWVRGVDRRAPAYSPSAAAELLLCDLREPGACERALAGGFDEVYQLAAEMGGAGFIFTGAHDAEVMHTSALVNLNVVEAAHRAGCGRIFFASSACIYPQTKQDDPERFTTAEASALPADPDSEYGWEKLFSERLYQAYQRNRGLEVRIGRYHNVFGPEGSWNDGREKAPAALCRKVAEAAPGGAIEVWGDGKQTRSFLYIDEALEGTLRLMRSGWSGPCNIGSAETISLDALARLILTIAGKDLPLRHVAGPQGVRGRSSDNRLIHEKLGWQPTAPLRAGLEATYRWVAAQVERHRQEG